MTGTTNLNLTKPTVGGDSDAWGGELNTDLDTLDALLQGAIYGLTLSAAGSTATFGIAAGAASGMVLASAYTKTASAWTLGSGNGALDTGAIANSTWYHVYLIQRSDTGVVDILISTSASSPTMPASYDRKRRIGAMRTDGSGQWAKFSQLGDTFLFGGTFNEYNGVTSGSTSAISLSLTVPTGIQVEALFNWAVQSAAGSNGTNLVTSLDQTDLAPSTAGNFTQIVPFGGAVSTSSLRIRTNTSGQVRARFINTDATYWTSTYGWIDRRGQ